MRKILLSFGQNLLSKDLIGKSYGKKIMMKNFLILNGLREAS